MCFFSRLASKQKILLTKYKYNISKKGKMTFQKFCWSGVKFNHEKDSDLDLDGDDDNEDVLAGSNEQNDHDEDEHDNHDRDEEEDKDVLVGGGGGNEENASKIHKKLPTSASKRPHTAI